MRRFRIPIIILLSLLVISFSSCDLTDAFDAPAETAAAGESGSISSTRLSDDCGEFDPAEVLASPGNAVVTVNGDIPYYKAAFLTTDSFELYSALDSLGRCGFAISCVGQELMPTEERGAIGMIKPSGWQTVKYDGIDGGYLYNRCHLIGYQLTGENDNVLNLITGTRYLNTEGMLPIENMVAEYIRKTGNHVLYRVTPVFKDDELVCRGVLMEGYSVEDDGDGICFCRFAYNIQPDITINYADGTSEGPEYVGGDKTGTTTEKNDSPAPEFETDADYVLNTNSHRFHYPWCSSVSEMSERNREEFYGTREEAIEQGYKPCSVCQP